MILIHYHKTTLINWIKYSDQKKNNQTKKLWQKTEFVLINNSIWITYQLEHFDLFKFLFISCKMICVELFVVLRVQKCDWYNSLKFPCFYTQNFSSSIERRAALAWKKIAISNFLLPHVAKQQQQQPQTATAYMSKHTTK